MTANVINSYAYDSYKIIDEDHGALKKALGLGKEEIKAFSAMDIGIEELDLYKDYRGSGKKVVIDDFVEYLKIKTIILFVRKKEEPDKPFYTLNIDPKDYHQIQCRGLQNCDTTKEVDQFLREWRRKKIDPLKRSKEKCKKTA